MLFPNRQARHTDPGAIIINIGMDRRVALPLYAVEPLGGKRRADQGSLARKIQPATVAPESPLLSSYNAPDISLIEVSSRDVARTVF